MGMLNAKNNVTYYQRYYQKAFKAGVPLWKIHPRSRYYLTPYLFLLWGTFGATVWCMGRKIAGHNTWFGKD